MGVNERKSPDNLRNGWAATVRSPALRRLLAMAEQVASVDSTVLITGEGNRLLVDRSGVCIGRGAGRSHPAPLGAGRARANGAARGYQTRCQGCYAQNASQLWRS